MINEPEFKSHRRHAREVVRILLVEDDPQFADLIQTQLRRMPWVESRLEVTGDQNPTLRAGAIECGATFLRLLRCEQAQGFLFARPMPAQELTRYWGAVAAPVKP